MKKLVLSMFFLLFVILIMPFFIYFNSQSSNEKNIGYCSVNHTDDCYSQMFELLLPNLLFNNAKISGVELKFANFDLPIYYPYVAMQKSQVGICLFDDLKLNKFNFFKRYLKDYKNFNVKNILNEENKHNELITFLNTLKENEYKAYVDISLKNMEPRIFEEILNYSDNISAIIVTINVEKMENIINSKKILQNISKNFVLVARSLDYGYRNGDFIYKTPFYIKSEYFKGKIYGSELYLVYINKNMIDDYSISLSQNTAKVFTGEKLRYNQSIFKMTPSNISTIVTITEFIKQKMNIFFKSNV